MADTDHKASFFSIYLAELSTIVQDLEPGTLSVQSGTYQLLEAYLRYLPDLDRRRWIAKHGEQLRTAVLG